MKPTIKRALVFALAGFLVLSLFALPAAAKDGKGRWLKIRVYEKGSSTPSVLVNLPMALVTAVVKIAAHGGHHATIDGSADISFGGKNHMQLHDVDIDEIIVQLESMDSGQIIEVQEEDQRVSIWIE